MITPGTIHSRKPPFGMMSRPKHEAACEIAVAELLAQHVAEQLGGTRQMGPEKNPEANLVVGHLQTPNAA